MEFTHIVQKRYAVKKFDGKKIPQDKLDALLELVRLAPSSFNIQPWFVQVVSSDALKQKLQAASWNQPQIGTSSHVLVFCARTDISDQITRLEALLKKEDSNDSLMGYVGMMRDFEKKMTSEQKLAWAQRQVYIALSNAINGATALGFDSCPMEGFDAGQVSQLLTLPSHLVPTVLCPIGHAADSPRAKVRFSKKDVFSFS